MLRHERQSVSMASPKPTTTFDRKGKTIVVEREGSEEVVHATHEAPRGRKTPHPGVRPGILAEPGQQKSDRSRRHSSAVLGRRGRQWTPPPSGSSRLLRWRLRGMRKRRRHGARGTDGGCHPPRPRQRLRVSSFLLGVQEEEEEEEKEEGAEGLFSILSHLVRAPCFCLSCSVFGCCLWSAHCLVRQRIHLRASVFVAALPPSPVKQ